MGIVYFIQPAELIGTNRYKIGRSKQDKLRRCLEGYKNKSRYICIMECDDDVFVESELKKHFNNKYKLFAGAEFFEGDEDDMRREFFKKVDEYILKNTERKNILTENVFDKFVDNTISENIKIFEDDTLNKYVINSLSEDSDDVINAVVDIIVHTNKGNICVVNNEWYMFDNNLWKSNDNIVRDMILKSIELYKKVKDSIEKLKEICDTKKNAYIKQIDRLIINIKKNKDIPNILAKKVTRGDKFDSNMNLIGFANGVYDFEKMEFRKGIPSDMIQKSCGYDYVDKYENKQNIINVLLKIFPDRKSMEFFLIYIITTICGNNNSKLLLTIKWTNIRYCEMLMHILSSTFGNYYQCINELSSIIAHGNKTPINLSHLKSSRIVVAESVNNIGEKEISKIIDVMELKHRNENKVIENFNTHFSVICMCEKIPTISEDVLKNVSILMASNIEHVDIKFNKNDFFLFLLEYLTKIKQGDVILDKKIGELDERSEETKICQMFMKDCIKKSKGNIKTKDIYARYIEWTNHKNLELKLTNRQLLSELRQSGLCYKNSVRFSNTTSSAFCEISIIY